jgi:hypothetical protein
MMHPRLPSVIAHILQEYLDQVREQLPGLLQGFYLEGSIALGRFNERQSDVDFIAFLTRKLNYEEIRIPNS